MCGRYVLSETMEALIRQFFVRHLATLNREWSARYNISPGTDIPVIRESDPTAGREMAFMRWGIVPHWRGDAGSTSGLANARSETAARKPAFRDSFLHRRCLVPANGFYEWERSRTPSRPLFFHLASGEPMAMGGIWQSQVDAAGRVQCQCALLTTGPNDLMRPIHDRLPVILQPADWEIWLKSGTADPMSLDRLCRPLPAAWLACHPVSPRVNAVRNEGPDLVAPVELPLRPLQGELFEPFGAEP